MSNRDAGHEPETVISASVKVEGDFISQGNILIEGEVEGSLRTDKDLRVGEHARISADVSASSATVAGEVRGNIDIAGRLELEPTAKIFGDVKTADLVVASGAIISGKITMGGGVEDAADKNVKATKVVPPAKNGKVTKDEAKEKAAEELDELIKEDASEKKESTKKTVNAFFTR
ncbi:MAG: polymer-forming cytoskeletal protein [Planctomycetota bacterium]|nr:polymer-forming cytoskeletal protein [Planctomycetota bacterium]